MEEYLSPHRAISEDLEALADRVGTLNLNTGRTTRCGFAKKWARKSRHAETPAGDCRRAISAGLPPRSSQTQTLHEPGTFGIETRGRKIVEKLA